MKKIMLVNAVESEEHRIAFISDGMLEGFHIDIAASEQKEGNIYKGVIDGIEPRLQACFVKFGSEKNGFLPADNVHPEYYNKDAEIPKEPPFPPIEKLLKKGQELLVEVLKVMPGRKGAHLTTYISLAGRYIVLTPGRTTNGVSRKIESEEERQRLKKIMDRMKLPEGVGYIIRTVAAGQNKGDISRDLHHLSLRTLRDYYTSDVSEIIVDDKETYDEIRDYMRVISPRDHRKVKLYNEKRPIFDHYNVEKQIESIYLDRVPLKSGGSIVFDTTEALIAIDINSGHAKGGKNAEGMIFKINKEAAAEIARQLRLRDLGGLVVIDFIDMKSRQHNREVEKILRDELKKGRAKTDISPISKFGLLELSRQRLRPSIESKSYQVCDHCQGRGMVISAGAAAVSYLRRIWKGVSKGDVSRADATLPLDVANYIQNRKRTELADLERRYDVDIIIKSDASLPPGGGRVEFIKQEDNKS